MLLDYREERKIGDYMINILNKNLFEIFRNYFNKNIDVLLIFKIGF